jgi:hypothetical protein
VWEIWSLTLTGTEKIPAVLVLGEIKGGAFHYRSESVPKRKIALYFSCKTLKVGSSLKLYLF